MPAAGRRDGAAPAATGPAVSLLQPVLDALDHATAAEIARDPFRHDPRFIRRQLPVLRAIAEYFDVEIRGWEQLPAQGPFLIVGNHSGGAETTDAVALLARWVDERGAEAPLYALAYNLLFAYPVIGRLLPKLGLLPASPENGRRALAQGAAVLVFPGGDNEVFRPWTHRNRVELAGHTGFVSLALSCGVPVVPMTIHGAHQSTFVLTRGDELARLLGLPRLRIKVFPLIVNIPFGITPAFVPSLQLPAKVTIELGRPLDWHQRFGPEQADDPAVLQQCYDEITGVMQATLDRLAQEHPYPVLERLNALRPSQVAKRWWSARSRSSRRP